MSCISRLFPVSSFMSIIIPFLETHVPLFPCLKRWFNYFFYLSLPYKAFFIRPTHADSTQAVCVQACVSLRKYALIAVLLRLNCPSNDSGGENESWPKAHVQKQPTSRRFIRFPLWAGLPCPYHITMLLWSVFWNIRLSWHGNGHNEENKISCLCSSLFCVF